ncbi:MAG TPA: UDP-N-acetylmuramoyl-tripeptide--D-alanyl-D-alanine ligase, partial [Limnobacter sp.]|nr:UDP-N-acetylmuramoyl-tripeptide--D-alanyl-D-alanine ligase [Limnobacter sp.]
VRLVQTDSRQVAPGDLFVCLIGERFDAHDFAAQVAAAGAIALVTNRQLDLPVTDQPVTQFVVKDTRLALGQLGKAWRQRFPVKTLAVVGSNGKTTTKEMLGSICKAQHGENAVLVTAGNLNNDIGVPQTLLRMRKEHTLAVIEMGMNHPGEIDYLAGLVQPDVALLTNAQREHQEFMKTVLAVAQENGSVFCHLQPQGTAVFPLTAEFDSCWIELAGQANILRFGVGADVEWIEGSSQACAGLNAGSRVLKLLGTEIDLKPGFIGEHNFSNAAGAAAAAHAAGCNAASIRRGLENFQPVSGRLQVALRKPSLLLINDTYNANPDSVNAASRVLASQQGQKMLVLGDMGEVGDQSDEYHFEVGQFARRVGVDRLLALGEATRHSVRGFGKGATHFSDINSLIEHTMNTTEQGHWSVLVKGSRFMKMERVVQALVQQHAGEASNAS